MKLKLCLLNSLWTLKNPIELRGIYARLTRLIQGGDNLSLGLWKWWLRLKGGVVEIIVLDCFSLRVTPSCVQGLLLTLCSEFTAGMAWGTTSSAVDRSWPDCTQASYLLGCTISLAS